MFDRKPSSTAAQQPQADEWIAAEVFFREGQKLDERFPQLRAGGEVRFEGGWLHFRPGGNAPGGNAAGADAPLKPTKVVTVSRRWSNAWSGRSRADSGMPRPRGQKAAGAYRSGMRRPRRTATADDRDEEPRCSPTRRSRR
ncbi:hypothetical protein GXW82_05770 [Streptacidiphilus sp. 4-A2]|nr:hypothetical protein [Streptacidiphilus sp. 4-A2]